MVVVAVTAVMAFVLGIIRSAGLRLRQGSPRHRGPASSPTSLH